MTGEQGLKKNGCFSTVSTYHLSMLPEIFKPFLWSYRFSAMDPERHKKTIIVQTVNYGDLRHWRWIADCYGKEEVRRVLTRTPASELRPRARKLAALIFSITAFNHAPRGVHKTE